MEAQLFIVRQTRHTTDVRRIGGAKHTAFLAWGDAKLAVDHKRRALKLAQAEYELALSQLREVTP